MTIFHTFNAGRISHKSKLQRERERDKDQRSQRNRETTTQLNLTEKNNIFFMIKKIYLLYNYRVVGRFCNLMNFVLKIIKKIKKYIFIEEYFE